MVHCVCISVLHNCHAGLRLTAPRSHKGTFKSTLQNCAKRPIGEYMRKIIYAISSHKFNNSIDIKLQLGK